MYRIIALCTLSLLFGCKSSPNTSLKDLHLKGSVSRLREETFKTEEKNGTFVKGDRVSFSSNNYLLCFRKDGNIEKRCEYWANGNIRYNMYYSYDIDGYIHEIELRTAENKTINRALYEYNKDDQVSKATYFDQHSFVKEYWQYEYDDDGNQTVQAHYAVNKQLLEKFLFAYDERGYCIEQINCNADGSTRSRFEYTRDERGNQIRCIWYSGNDTFDFKYEYEYDEYDNQVKAIIYKDTSDVSYISTIYQYEYDKYKNWVRCYEWNNDKVEKIRERKIEYYE